jgi:hypothetical protein
MDVFLARSVVARHRPEALVEGNGLRGRAAHGVEHGAVERGGQQRGKRLQPALAYAQAKPLHVIRAGPVLLEDCRRKSGLAQTLSQREAAGACADDADALDPIRHVGAAVI